MNFSLKILGLVLSLGLCAQAQQVGQDVAQTIANQGKHTDIVKGMQDATDTLGATESRSYGGTPTASGSNSSILRRKVPVVLKCAPLDTPYYIGALGLKTTDCKKTADGTVTLLKIDVCAQNLLGGDCTDQTWLVNANYIGLSTESSYYYSRTTPNIFVTFQVTGVCSKEGCPAIVFTESFLSVSGSNMHKTGVTAQTQGDNTLARQAEIVNNPQYVNQLNNTSGQFKSCQEAIQTAANAGQVFTTCDGRDSNYVGGGCYETRTCSAYQNQNREWTEKCQTEVPTVRRDCNTLTPTRVCTTTKSQQECTYEMATKSCPKGTCTAPTDYVLISSDATTDYFAQIPSAAKSSCSAPIPTVPNLAPPYETCSGWNGQNQCVQYFMGYCIKFVEKRTCSQYSKQTCTDAAFPACTDVFASPIQGAAATILSAPRCPVPLASSANTASCVGVGTPVCKIPGPNGICLVETQQQYCPGLSQRTCFTPTPPLEPVVCKPIPEASGCRDKYVLDPATGLNLPADPRIAPAAGSVQGICLNNWTSEGCYAGKPESCIQSKPTLENPQNCYLNKQTCVTEVLGVCGTVEQEYKCSETRSTCTSYTKDTKCNGSLTQGTEKQAPAPATDSFGKAAAAMGVVEGIQKSETQGILIFNGDPMACKKPTWILNTSNYLANDCCRRDLEKTNPGKPLHKCSEDAVKMAAGRRANRTYPLGDFCSNKKPWPFGCQERTQVDCVFPSLLAKDVQVGGRKQLLALASDVAGASQSKPIAFNYYTSPSTPETWTMIGNIGARPIFVYRWPAYCATAELETAYMAANPNALLCNSGLMLYFAVCDKSDICTQYDKFPKDPRVGAPDWTINGLNPLVDTSTSLTADATVKGSCNPANGQCNYIVTTWTNGGTLTAYAQANLQFEVGTGSLENSILVGDWKFFPQWQSTASTTWVLSYQNVKENKWQQLAMGLDIQAPGAPLPGTNGIQIYGSCSAITKICQFKLRIPVQIKPKPWGTAENPKCSGFTPEELSVLDFSKIDLSEFVATVKAAAPKQADVQNMATNSLNSTVSTQLTGATKADREGSAVRILKIMPEEVSGCFQKDEPECQRGRVKVIIPGNWPEWTPEARDNVNARDTIIQASVNWGDGRQVTPMTRLPNSDILTAEHSYWEQGANTQHLITVSIITPKSGSQWVTGYVNNFTKDPSKGAGIGLNPTGQYQTSYAPRTITPSDNTPSGVSGNAIPGPKPGS